MIDTSLAVQNVLLVDSSADFVAAALVRRNIKAGCIIQAAAAVRLPWIEDNIMTATKRMAKGDKARRL